jgi:hypothetical protein
MTDMPGTEDAAYLSLGSVQPTTFKPDFLNGLIGFEIGFTNEREAALFDQQFG